MKNNKSLFLFFNISAFSGDNCCIKQALKVIDFNSAGTIPTFLITKNSTFELSLYAENTMI